jgi:4-amino-4-deoxy-L-arabinose transferase-like glycosyltransferase
LNATSSAPAPASPGKTGLLLFLAVLALACPQAALLPLLDRDEPRFAEASREMLQSGNYVVPTFNQEPRYAKPPLIYWCQAACFEIFGENAFAARLPSLLATAGTALLLFAWGAGLGQRSIGLIAALSYAFCLQAVQQGRVATADALLIFFMTLTGFAGWRLLALAKKEPATEGWGGWNFLGTVLALGLGGGFLAKGPEALLPIAPLLICGRSLGGRVLFSIIAIFLLGLFMVSWWAVPAYVQTNGAYWQEGLGKDVGERMVTGFQGHGATTFLWYLLGLPFYLLLFWPSALPWSPLLVMQRRRLFGSWKPDALDAYLLLNAGLIFVIFSLMVTKLPHYTLPAFPFIALFFARRWISSGFCPRLPVQLAGGTGIILAVLAGIAISIAMGNNATPSPAGELVQAAQGRLTPETEFALVDFQEPNAIWEMRRVVKGHGKTIPESEVVSFLAQPGPRAVVLSTALWEKMKKDASPAWKTYEARGFNAAKLSWLDLTLVVNR